MNQIPPVITIDGPSGTGKGTLCLRLAQALKWHYLDSGSIYRILAYASLQRGIDLSDSQAVVMLVKELDVHFEYDEHKVHITLNNQEITNLIRTEACANAASKIGALPQVRLALVDKQRSFRQQPGLVTDGRDMGTAIFPDADIKLYLNASAEERAKRRYKQLKEKGIHVSLGAVQRDLIERDQRDIERAASPLKPASDAILIDTTEMDIEQVFKYVLNLIKSKLSID